ncbi:MAG: hypothetical protein AAFV25_07060 [Bacteroidota bacterium]
MKAPLLLLIALIAAISWNCSSPSVDAAPSLPTAFVPENTLPSLQELNERFWQARKITIVYPAASPQSKDLQRLADSLHQNIRRYIEVTIKTDEEVQAEDWTKRALLLLGCPDNHQLLQELLPDLPFDFQNQQLQFDGQTFAHPTSSLVLPFYPNPLEPSMPLAVVTANSDQALLEFMTKQLAKGWRLFGFGNWGYELFQNNQRILLGLFHQEKWVVDKKVHYNFSQAEPRTIETKHFQFVLKEDALSLTDAQAFAEEMEQEATSVQQFLQKQHKGPKIKYCLYASTEQKGLMLNNSQQAHLSNKSIHEVVNDIYRPFRTAAAAQMLCRQQLGWPKTKALERGLAVYLTPQWQQKGYAYWAAKLHHSDNLRPLSELLNNAEFERGSPLIGSCLAASFVAYLIDANGKETFLKKYQQWEAKGEELARLEKEWKAHLSQLTLPSSPIVAEKTFYKGFNFAHEGYMGYNGYGSRKAREAAQKIRSINSNALAVVPYSYMANPERPDFISIRRSAYSETDEGVIHSQAIAREQSMAAMLKPQIWVGNGKWTGDIRMRTEADWQSWFRHYHRWISHYALLAEIHQFELFCIGTELIHTTLERPADWRQLISRIDKLYSGQLTYASNWGQEFEQSDIWQQLDYLGIDCYYPLSNKTKATNGELRKGFRSILRKIEKVQSRHDKQVLFTEIGFRSKEAPWIEPHAGDRREQYQGEDQSRSYQIVLEGLKGKEWCKGIFWWKFPSYMEFDRSPNAGFSPCGKPAEETVKKEFAKLPGK